MVTITEYIEPLLRGESLGFERATSLLDVIFEGQVPEAQIAAFLTAMRAKGPTASEVAGLAKSLRNHAVKVVDAAAFVAGVIVLDHAIANLRLRAHAVNAAAVGKEQLLDVLRRQSNIINPHFIDKTIEMGSSPFAYRNIVRAR